MTPLKRLAVLLLLGGIGAPAAAQELWTPAAADSALRWPLDLPTRYLTSNFMEYRPGRYHAGLDLKTRSTTGFPVYAVADGSIVRIRATARAYGRAVYLQTADGATYVYAHLERFNDEIRARVRLAQQRSGAYRTEMYLEPGELRVRQGQVLGLSGQSGTSGPHLHFEVRDAAQRPLNPLDHGFAVEDRIAPSVLSLRAVPADCDARIFGRREAFLAELVGRGPLAGVLDTLRITGPVALTAGVLDYTDIRGHLLAPYRLEVFLDGMPVFSSCNESFAFAQSSRQGLEWFTAAGLRERWLHRRPQVDLPGRAGEAWPWGPDGRGLTPGDHLVQVRVTDQQGGAAQVTVPVVVSAGPSEASDREPAATGIWMPGESGPRPDPDGPCTLSPFCDECGRSSGLSPRMLTPEQGDPVLAAMTLWTRSWPVDSLAVATAGRQGLQVLSPSGGEYLAADWPLESPLTVDLPAGGAGSYDPQDPAVGIYRWTGEDWTVAGLLLAAESGRPCRFQLEGPGRYALLADRTAPRLPEPNPAGGSLVVRPGPASTVSGVTLPYWEVFALPWREEGSGVAEQTIAVTVDGQLLVVEPDLPRDRVLVELPDDLPAGPHRVRIELSDAAGNAAGREYAISCTDQD